MPNIHPLVVHFPIALLSAGIMFDILGLWPRFGELSRVGWWTQLAGTIGLAAAVLTGLRAPETVSFPDDARGIFENHEQLAFAVTALFSALLLWRIASRTQVPPRHKVLFIGLCVVGLIMLWMAAWYGGEMVYHFGVGVRSAGG